MAHVIDVIVKGASPTDSGQLLASTGADAAAWSSAVHPTATTPSLDNGWTGAAGQEAPSYWRDAFGVVHLNGVGDGSGASSGTLFTLPSGYRPTAARRFVASLGSGTSADVVVATSGTVTTSSTTAFQCLDNITFRTW